jgi:hypothetical protein
MEGVIVMGCDRQFDVSKAKEPKPRPGKENGNTPLPGGSLVLGLLSVINGGNGDYAPRHRR